MKSALVFLVLVFLASSVHAEPTVQRVVDEFEDSEFVFTVGGEVELDDSAGEKVTLDYGGAIGPDGKMLGFVVIVNYRGEDWIFIKEIRLRTDENPSMTLKCHASREANKHGGGVSELCLADVEKSVIESISTSTKIRIGVGSLKGTANPSAAILLLDQFKE